MPHQNSKHREPATLRDRSFNITCFCLFIVHLQLLVFINYNQKKITRKHNSDFSSVSNKLQLYMRTCLYISPKTSDWAFNFEACCTFQFNVKQHFVLLCSEVGVSIAGKPFSLRLL